MDRYNLFPLMKECPFCHDRLDNYKQYLVCGYCGSKYLITNDVSEKHIEEAAEKGVFLIKKR